MAWRWVTTLDFVCCHPIVTSGTSSLPPVPLVPVLAACALGVRLAAGGWQSPQWPRSSVIVSLLCCQRNRVQVVVQDYDNPVRKENTRPKRCRFDAERRRHVGFRTTFESKANDKESTSVSNRHRFGVESTSFRFRRFALGSPLTPPTEPKSRQVQSYPKESSGPFCAL